MKGISAATLGAGTRPGVSAAQRHVDDLFHLGWDPRNVCENFTISGGVQPRLKFVANRHRLCGEIPIGHGLCARFQLVETARGFRSACPSFLRCQDPGMDIDKVGVKISKLPRGPSVPLTRPTERVVAVWVGPARPVFSITVSLPAEAAAKQTQPASELRGL